MTYEELGYNEQLENYRNKQGLNALDVGRVIAEHKERYVVKTPDMEFDSELIGNLRFTAESRSDLPAVGDWVAMSEYDEGKALIHAIYPRFSSIERQAVGKHGQTQIIATNIDVGLIVQSVNRDFSINRLERYLTICNASKVKPVIILSKIDLVDEKTLEDLLQNIRLRIKDVSVIPISNQSNSGLDLLETMIQKGQTYCLLGSSGVGKSTLLNKMTGTVSMTTGEISERIDRGKHVTSHRELIVLEQGGILIDNPGMREVGIADVATGLEMTFEAITDLVENCKYKDCTHINEKGCAILEAVKGGEIDAAAYANFLKMQKERAHFEATAEERKAKDKSFGKMIKNVKKQRRDNKY